MEPGQKKTSAPAPAKSCRSTGSGSATLTGTNLDFPVFPYFKVCFWSEPQNLRKRHFCFQINGTWLKVKIY
jgi:hypothetical protein